MNVTVINEFVDKHTGELREVGSSFACSKERFEEIQSSGDFVAPESKHERKKDHGINQ